MKVISRFFFLITLLLSQSVSASAETIEKILFVGDSMTGWLADRLNAYGARNGFTVDAVIWDGSTIRKWGDNSARLMQIIARRHPDAVFVSLGMNELFDTSPEATQGTSLDRLLAAVGDTPLVWVGPPSWPGKKGGDVLNSWLAGRLGQDRFFNSSSLSLPRQSAGNPHPSKAGICRWVDAIVKWIPSTGLPIELKQAPDAAAMSRCNYFLYRRMKEKL